MYPLFIMMALLCALPEAAFAQQKQTFTIRGGKLVGGSGAASGQQQGGGGQASRLVIDQDQQLIFSATASVLKKDYPTAEKLYSQALAIDSSNINAYLQRGFVRREMGNTQGVESDARTAITLANNALKSNPRDSDIYYQRSMALRLIHQFELAKKDILTALQLGGKQSLQNDLKAIDLEQKIMASQVVAR